MRRSPKNATSAFFVYGHEDRKFRQEDRKTCFRQEDKKTCFHVKRIMSTCLHVKKIMSTCLHVKKNMSTCLHVQISCLHVQERRKPWLTPCGAPRLSYCLLPYALRRVGRLLEVRSVNIPPEACSLLVRTTECGQTCCVEVLLGLRIVSEPRQTTDDVQT